MNGPPGKKRFYIIDADVEQPLDAVGGPPGYVRADDDLGVIEKGVVGRGGFLAKDVGGVS
jgi:hypothetical protein